MVEPKLYLILAFAGLLFIQTGCEKENGAPSCTITYPKNGENIPHGSQVIISVDAVDTDGIIDGVNFYIDNSSVGIINRYPYNYEWNTLDQELGSHIIKATAIDDSRNTISDEITVFLTEGVPVADFAANQISISLDSSGQFFDRSINNPVSWLWDFGDGNTSDSKNPSHAYSSLGTYTISLTVTNSYGSDIETKTDYITVTAPLTDYDGNVYQTVQIGEQLWMKENLKTTHYADGTALIDGTGAGDISDDYTTKYYFANNDDESNVATYGRLYTWAAATNGVSDGETNPGEVQGACPAGWHVPADKEWIELEIYLGMSKIEATKTELRGTDEGVKLRDNSKNYWTQSVPYFYLGTNESGLTALPAGNRSYNGSYVGLKYGTGFWSATESINSWAWVRRLFYDKPTVYRYDRYKSRGYSVRCVKD